MKQYFKDTAYGSTASLTDTGKAFRLIIRDYMGRKAHDKTYGTARGAKIALGKYGGSWWTVRGSVEDK